MRLFFHGKLCVTLTSETEWVELLELGVNMLASADLTKTRDALLTMSDADLDISLTPYGFGDSSDQLVNVIARSMQVDERRQ